MSFHQNIDPRNDRQDERDTMAQCPPLSPSQNLTTKDNSDRKLYPVERNSGVSSVPGSLGTGNGRRKSGKKRRRRQQGFQSRDYGTLPQEQRSSSRYWNELENGPESGFDDQYTILINPEDPWSTPWLDSISSFFKSLATQPRSWWRGELHAHPPNTVDQGSKSISDNTQDVNPVHRLSDDDDTSTIRPATDTSKSDLTKHDNWNSSWEARLHYTCVGSIVASYIFLAIASVQLATRRHNANRDPSVSATVLLALAFAFIVFSVGCLVARKQNPGWVYRLFVNCAALFGVVIGLPMLMVVSSPLR